MDPLTAAAERALVERCRAGDEHAFQELVDRHKDLVFALIARTVRIDRGRRIWRRMSSCACIAGLFSRGARLSTWIYRIVANVCLQDHSKPAASESLDDDRRSRSAPGATDRQFGDLELRDRLEKRSRDCRPLPAGDRGAPARDAIRLWRKRSIFRLGR
jgi:RNA polymerase sigma-70 factor (ECF subfamily)